MAGRKPRSNGGASDLIEVLRGIRSDFAGTNGPTRTAARSLGALPIAILVAGCGARSGLELWPVDVSADAATDGAIDGAIDAGTPGQPDAGEAIACDGLPLPRPGAVTTIDVQPRAQGLGVLIPDPPGILVTGGLTSERVEAEYSSQMAFLDLGRGLWQELPVEGDRVQLPLRDAAAVYVPADLGRVVVIGGTVEGGVLTDQVFSFTGEGDPGGLRQVRARLLPEYPGGPTGGHGAIYDPVDHRVVVHGGGSRATWSLLLEPEERWEQIVSAEDSPPAGTRAMGYDPDRHRAIEISDDEDGVGVAVHALSLDGPYWEELGPIDFVPSTAGELLWDERACGFHLLSARTTRCILEHWVLSVENDHARTVYRGEVELEPSHFLAAATFVRSSSEIVIHSSEDCQNLGWPNVVAHRVQLLR